VADAAQGLVFGQQGTSAVDPNLAYLNQQANIRAARPVLQANFPLPKKELPMTTRRVVQVFIVDTFESVPLDQCVIYQGEQKLTDLTDQELFFEVDIKSLLDAHNAKRVKLVDKRVKERTEYLEPARIRDLKMTVVTVATF
jgi:hypothetical protein